VRIVAIDRSFSMGAPGQFSRALDLARRAVDEATLGERVAVVAFDDHAETLAAAGPAGAARAALAGLTPGFGATKYGEALAKAAEIAAGDEGRLIMITDLQRAGWENDQHGVLPANLALDVRSVGAPPANVAVTGIRVGSDRIIATVLSTGTQTRSGLLRLERDGRTAATAAYSVPPGSTADVPIIYKAPTSGAVAVALDDGEGLVADNRRFAVLDPVAAEPVLVVTSGETNSGFFVQRALAAAAGMGPRPIEARTVTGPSVPELRPSEYPAVLLLSGRGLERRTWEALAAYVNSGGGLVIAGSPDVDALVLSSMFKWTPRIAGPIDVGATVTLSPTDLRHPIFRPFGPLTANLGQVHFSTAWNVASDGWDLVARFTDGRPALVERREGQGRVLVFASDLDRRWNDFPLNPAFVPFVVETVRYACGTHDRGRDYLVGAAPQGADRQPGVYRASADNRSIAVNVDPHESATAVVDAKEFAGMIERVSTNPKATTEARAVHVEAGQRYWQYGLLLMLMALVAESFVGRA
jgi:von Willebrand factor type A domain